MPFEYLNYKGIKFMPGIYSKETLSFVENGFQVMDDDVFVVTYPKSGTVWMIEILNLIRSDGDPTWCRTVPVWDRAPWFASDFSLKHLESYQPPRLLTSHLPIQLFPKSAFNSEAKIIYVYRHPKDVLVSLYCYTKIASFFKTPASFDEFVDDFLAGDVPYGSWFDHIKGWMEMRDKSNFLFITYEELQEDLRGSVLRICTFLGKELTEKAVDAVVRNANFESMKSNKMANFTLLPSELIDHEAGSFIRKGISGDWKSHFTVAQSEYFDRVYQEKMKDLKVKLF